MNTVSGSVPVIRQLLQLGCFVHTHAVSRASSERAEGERRGTNSSVEAVTDFFWLVINLAVIVDYSASP